MNLQQQLKVLGLTSILIGSIAAVLCIIPHGLFLAIPVGFLGMLCSGIYVFIDTRNELNTKKITSGIIGMILSSIPVLFILTFMLINYFNKTS